MNKQQRSSTGIWIGMLFIIALPLVFYSQSRHSGVATPQEASPTVQTIDVIARDTPSVTPFTPVVIEEPTWKPFPTMTPWPSPTPRIEPTATALPPLSIPDSPSGHIFYFSRSKFQVGPEGFDEAGDVYQMQIDASGKNALAQPTENNGLYRLYPSWDKSLIAVVNMTMSGDKVTIYDSSGKKLTSYMNTDNFFGFFAGWHPNGKELLFRVDRNVYAGLWLINIETGSRTIVTYEDTLYITDAAVSPNGQQIIYRRQVDWKTKPELWLVFADGSKPQQIGSDDSTSGLSWSPDGKNVAYFASSGLCVIRIENPQCRLLSSNVNALDFFTPLWSPNGQYIAYVGYSANHAAQDKQSVAKSSKDWNKHLFNGSTIFTVDTSSGEQNALLDPKSSDIHGGYIDPTWSPDGSMLAFAGYDGTKGMIITISLNDLKPHIVATYEDIVRFPTWTK